MFKFFLFLFIWSMFVFLDFLYFKHSLPFLCGRFNSDQVLSQWRICKHGGIDWFYNFLVILDSQTPKCSSKIRETLSVILKTTLNFDLKTLRNSLWRQISGSASVYIVLAEGYSFSTSYFLYKFCILKLFSLFLL